MTDLQPLQGETWINSADYIKGLNFDYIETYSFNRLDPLLTIEFDKLSQRRQQGRLSVPDMNRFEELNSLYNGSELLLDDNRNFHHSCEKMSTFQIDNPQILHFKQIMQMEIVECFHMLCAPYYRDAVVFYNSSGQVVSVLNICLSCHHMTTGHQKLKADFEVYDLLKKFLLSNGHRIENPDYFLMNEFGDMKAKFLAAREEKQNNNQE